MKKLISILVVFALAATVSFAQEGSWSVSGSGEIGTIINLLPDYTDGEGNVKEEPRVGLSAFNRYGWYDDGFSQFSVNYSNGDLSAGIYFKLNGNIGAKVKYDNGDAWFEADAGLMDLLLGTAFDPSTPNFALNKLWGSFSLFDGAVRLEAAVKSGDPTYWASSTAHNDPFGDIAAQLSGWKVSGIGGVFADVDGHNYLLADFNLSSLVDGLSAGFIIPGLFVGGLPGDSDPTKGFDEGDNKWQRGGGYNEPNGNFPGYFNGWGGDFDSIPLYAAFSYSIFGVKYASGPLDAAVQFALKGVNNDKLNSGLYFGANYAITDQIKAGFSLKGTFDGDDSDKSSFAAGVSFSYNDGPFGASVAAALVFKNKDDKGLMGIKPSVSYNIVENYLCFSLDAALAFDFNSGTGSVAEDLGLYFELTPTLWFNVMGTGAGAGYYWPNGTAIIVRYKVGGYSKNTDVGVNALDITFKWGF